MTDYMDTAHYRVNKFAAAARVMDTLNRKGEIRSMAGCALTIDDLETVIREWAEMRESRAYAVNLAEALKCVRGSIANGLKFDGAKWLLFESGRDSLLDRIDAALATNPQRCPPDGPVCEDHGCYQHGCKRLRAPLEIGSALGPVLESSETDCPACGKLNTAIQFDGKTAWLHCHTCGSDTAGAALLDINNAIVRGMKAAPEQGSAPGPWGVERVEDHDTLWRCAECKAKVWCGRTPGPWGHEETCRHYPHITDNQADERAEPSQGSSAT